MIVTLEIDDELLARAIEVSGITDLAVLLHEALKTLIDLEEKRSLERLKLTPLQPKST